MRPETFYKHDRMRDTVIKVMAIEDHEDDVVLGVHWYIIRMDHLEPTDQFQMITVSKEDLNKWKEFTLTGWCPACGCKDKVDGLICARCGLVLTEKEVESDGTK